MSTHTTRKHARLSASRTSRFMACPGSVLLENQMPYEPAGPAAQYGTEVHELAEHIMRGDTIDFNAYDDEQVEMAQGYVTFINQLCESPRKKLIEVNVDEGLQSLHPALGGTADAVLVEGNTLHVCDLKTGRIKVDAEENPQLLTYALGAMRKFNAPADINVVLHIYQPRAGGVSSWHTDGSRLIEHGHNLRKAAELALTDNAPTNPGDEQCKYCRAKTICPSIRAKATEAAKKDFQPDATVTPDDLELAHTVSHWAEQVIESAKKQLADKPESITGWTMRPGRKTRFWNAPEMAEEALKDYRQAWELKSPAAIAKLKIDLPEGLISEKQSAPSLVRAKSKD